VIQVEGVLRKPVGGAVLDSGRRIYHGLASMYSIVLVTEAANKTHMKTWLGMEGFSKHAHVVYRSDFSVYPEDVWTSIAMDLRNTYSYDVAMCVVPDPADAAALLGRGFNTMLVTSAAYSLPEWRPDAPKAIRAWDDLSAEIAVQRALRAADKRTEEELS
jgi:hypothetical protein